MAQVIVVPLNLWVTIDIIIVHYPSMSSGFHASGRIPLRIRVAARQDGCDKFFPQIVLNEVGEVGNAAVPLGNRLIDKIS